MSDRNFLFRQGAATGRQAGVRGGLYAFEEAFGLSPKQYLQRYRLNQVKRLLSRRGSGDLTVSDAANSWGFWHMGQFAADYRKMFGERPGETLARAR